MITTLALTLTILGAAILIASLFPVVRVIRQLPAGILQQRWYVLLALIAFFIAGYLFYAYQFRDRHTTITDLVVPVIFLLGAMFVGLTTTLALQTALDLQRVVILENENITDALTGLFNRRYLDRRLEEEFLRARRYNLNLSLMLLDIDHFKSVNDRFGHQSGDKALRSLGNLILEAVRKTDLVARYGGEEIMIIALNTNPEGAWVLAERLRQLIESHEIEIDKKEGQPDVITITASFGVAGLTDPMATTKQLVRAVDEALYQAKQNGRNQVVVGSSDAGADRQIPQ
jgi:diguanylate cyclase (GGDEF)-like protein